MRELITLQMGPYANFVGAQFWQLKLDDEGPRGPHPNQGDESGSSIAWESILFRNTAISHEAPRKTPRLLVFDDENGIRGLNAAGGQHGQSDIRELQAEIPWAGSIDVHRQDQASRAISTSDTIGAPRAAISSSLHTEPRSWTEIFTARLPPPCVVAINKGASAGVDEPVRWDAEEHGNRLRLLLEECDAPQGMHTLLDLSHAFMSLGVGATQEFAEEVPEAGLACFCYETRVKSPLGPNVVTSEERLRRIDAALTLTALSELDQALVVPLTTTPSLADGKVATKAYEATAVHAAALRCATGVYCGDRSTAPRCRMRDWVEGILGVGAPAVASFEMALPFPPQPAAALNAEALNALLMPTEPLSSTTGFVSFLRPLWPSVATPGDIIVKRYSGAVALSGLPAPPSLVVDVINNAVRYYPWFQPQLSHASCLPVPTYRPPYSNIVSNETQSRGCGIMTTMGCTSGVAAFYRQAADALRSRIPPDVKARLASRGLLEDDLTEAREALARIAEQLCKAGDDMDEESLAQEDDGWVL